MKLPRQARRWWEYLRWRLKGSPLVTGQPVAREWLERIGKLTPPEVGTRDVIVLPMSSPSPELVESIAQQSHKQWAMRVLPGAELGALDGDPRITRTADTTTGALVARAARQFPDALLVLIYPDVTLEPNALAWLATVPGDIDLAYGDHVTVGWGGSVTPVLKPAWSPRLLGAYNYIGRTVALRPAVVHQSVSPDSRPGDMLRWLAARRSLRVAHLPVPLTRERRSDAAPSSPGTVSRTGPWVTVKVVIPTRDRVDLLKRAVAAVRSAREITTELVIVDNGSQQVESRRYLDSLAASGAVIVRMDEPFNFSRLINRGAGAGAPCDHLLMLNNDIEGSDPRWLAQLCGWLTDPGVVAVGPKLLFPDGRIQHAGMVHGLGGIAGHYALGLRRVPAVGSPDLPREVSFLTGACLLVRTRDFEAVGGLDEDLAIDHQDVDLCLRLRSRLGGDLMYDPTYPLVHLQMGTRDPAAAGSEETVRLMRSKWGPMLDESDPFWNLHLNLMPPGGGLAAMPESDVHLQHRLRVRVRTSV